MGELKEFEVEVRAYKTILVDARDEHEARRLVDDPENEEWVRDAEMYTWDVIRVKQVGKSGSKHKGITFGK